MTFAPIFTPFFHFLPCCIPAKAGMHDDYGSPFSRGCSKKGKILRVLCVTFVPLCEPLLKINNPIKFNIPQEKPCNAAANLVKTPPTNLADDLGGNQLHPSNGALGLNPEGD